MVGGIWCWVWSCAWRCFGRRRDGVVLVMAVAGATGFELVRTVYRDMFCPRECVNFRRCGCRARCLKFSRNVLDIDAQGRFLKWGACGLEGWMSIAKVDVEVKK